MDNSDQAYQEISPNPNTPNPTIQSPIPELDALGVRYHMEYGQARSRYLRSVCLPWTPEQWVGVLHREGQWLPTCCANISAIRSYLMSALADGGWLDMRVLSDIIDLLSSHDSFSDWFEIGFTPEAETLEDPLYIFPEIWRIAKDRRWASWMEVPYKRSTEGAMDLSGRDLEKALSYYNSISLLHVGDWATPELKVKAQFRHDHQMIEAVARVVPSLKKFTDSLAGKTLSPLEGFAIVSKNDRDEILETRGGAAIYHSMANAEDTINYWCTNDQDKDGEPYARKEDFEIRPVIVSMETGVIFQDISRR